MLPEATLLWRHIAYDRQHAIVHDPSGHRAPVPLPNLNTSPSETKKHTHPEGGYGVPLAFSGPSYTAAWGMDDQAQRALGNGKRGNTQLNLEQVTSASMAAAPVSYTDTHTPCLTCYCQHLFSPPVGSPIPSLSTWDKQHLPSPLALLQANSFPHHPLTPFFATVTASTFLCLLYL